MPPQRPPGSDVAIVWAAYLFALPFQRVWVLPWLGIKLQPPEIVFVALATVAVAQSIRRRARWRFVLADAAAIAWVVANLVAFAWSREPHGRDGLIELVGAVYVASLYGAVRATATPQLLDRIGEWFGYSAAIAAVLGIIGAVGSYAGWTNRLATSALVPVPYLGHAARAQAFAAGPQMLASILVVAILLVAADRAQRGWTPRDCVLVGVLVLGLAATVSKTALCLVAAIAVMWACAGDSQTGPSSRRPHARLWAAAIVLIVICTFALGSHLMLVRQNAVPVLTTMQLVSGSPLISFRWRGDVWVVMPTTYVFNKEASIEAIKSSWPAGLGPAAQPAFTTALQREGMFPRSIWFVTPHSTYLGTVAELGAAGLAALVLIVWAGGTTIHRLLNGPSRLRWEAAAYAGAGAVFLIDAISTDMLNYRHYWFLFATMASRLAVARAQQPLVATPRALASPDRRDGSG